jgi:hypothetical protein
MPAAAAKLSKHYQALSGPERFVAVIDAMARGDLDEDRRLDDACPRVLREVDDPAYRSRMSVSFAAAAIATASIRADLEVLRALATVKEIIGVFRRFAEEGAEDAFQAGWLARGAADREKAAAAEGGGTAAATDQADDDDESGDDLAPAAEEELGAARELAAVKLDIAVRVVDRREGDHRAVSLLSAWEGLGRFARDSCGVEPLALVKAWRLLDGDPAAEVRKMYPKAKAEEALAAQWHASLAGPWERHAAGL